MAATYDAQDVIPLFPTERPTIATLLLIAFRAADNEEASAKKQRSVENDGCMSYLGGGGGGLGVPVVS